MRSTNEIMNKFANLNKNKSYVFVQSGEGLVSDRIKNWSLNDMKMNDLENIIGEIPSHAGLLYYSYFYADWMVLESHFKSKGVHEITLTKWLRQYCKHADTIEFFEQAFDLSFARSLIGTHYGTMNIFRMSIERWLEFIFKANLSFSMPFFGLVCSGYVAKVVPEICKFFEIKNYEVAPYHIKYFYKSKKTK